MAPMVRNNTDTNGANKHLCQPRGVCSHARMARLDMHRLDKALLALGMSRAAMSRELTGKSDLFKNWGRPSVTVNPRDPRLLDLADKVNVSVEYLTGQSDEEHPGSRGAPAVLELDARAGAGLGDAQEGDKLQLSAGVFISSDSVKNHWHIPNDFLAEVRAKAEDVRIVEVIGDSGYDPAHPSAPGSLLPGDRLMVVVSDRKPSPPGPFLVWDGLGLVVKLVDYIGDVDPPRYRLSSRNPAYQPYEVTVEEAHIVGRIRGRFEVI